MNLVIDIMTIAAFTAGLIAIYVYLKLSPIIKLDIKHKWIMQDYLKVTLIAENTSKVRLRPELIRFQLLEHKKENLTVLSEWVPFEEDAVKDGEAPISWREPVKVYDGTDFLYPSERIVIERLYHLPNNNVIHVGFQAKIMLTRWVKHFSRIGKNELSYTTTRVISAKAIDPNRG